MYGIRVVLVRRPPHNPALWLNLCHSGSISSGIHTASRIGAQILRRLEGGVIDYIDWNIAVYRCKRIEPAVGPLVVLRDNNEHAIRPHFCMQHGVLVTVIEKGSGVCRLPLISIAACYLERCVSDAIIIDVGSMP